MKVEYGSSPRLLAVRTSSCATELADAPLRPFRVTHACGGASLADLEGPPDIVLLVAGSLSQLRRDDLAAVQGLRSGRYLPVCLSCASFDGADELGLLAQVDLAVLSGIDAPDLAKRLRSLLRRTRPGVLSERFSCGTLVLDSECMRLSGPAGSRAVTVREHALLARFLDDYGTAITRDELSRSVWGQAEGGGRTVDATVARLRKTLRAVGVQRCIRSVRATGYMLRFEPGSPAGRAGVAGTDAACAPHR